MKSAIFVTVLAAVGLIGTTALACPVGEGSIDRPTQRPIQNVSLQASELFERAQELESAASSRDRQASALERDAETLASRARVLRNQAQLVAFNDRQSVLAVADELSTRAAVERARASEERASAADLRIQARSMRERALQLVRLGNGGGWRGGGDKRPAPRAAGGDTAI